MPLTLADTLPTDSPEREYLWTLNFGPQHPATHTTLRLILTLDGERVVDAVPHIGYLHSGFEKLGEHLDFNQYVTVVDRMNRRAARLHDVNRFVTMSEVHLVETVVKIRDSQGGDWRADMKLGLGRGSIDIHRRAENKSQQNNRDDGAQGLAFLIGGADGLGLAALFKADRVMSFGPMTLPHGLARIILAEQIYRAETILAGHPYHRA